MAVDVADDPPHVFDVVGVIRLVVPEVLDDLAPRLVALGLSATIALAHGLRLHGLDQFFNSLRLMLTASLNSSMICSLLPAMWTSYGFCIYALH
jgi:hypothetical protein